MPTYSSNGVRVDISDVYVSVRQKFMVQVQGYGPLRYVVERCRYYCDHRGDVLDKVDRLAFEYSEEVPEVVEALSHISKLIGEDDRLLRGYNRGTK